MMKDAPQAPYVYQPFGMQRKKHWNAGLIYAIGGLAELTTISGLTKSDAERVLAALSTKADATIAENATVGDIHQPRFDGAIEVVSGASSTTTPKPTVEAEPVAYKFYERKVDGGRTRVADASDNAACSEASVGTFKWEPLYPASALHALQVERDAMKELAVSFGMDYRKYVKRAEAAEARLSALEGKVGEIFDVRVTTTATSPEPSIRKIVFDYYKQTFSTNVSETLTANLIEALRNTLKEGE